MENGAFENCANITLLDLSHNKISSIPKRAFDETTYATELHLAYNNLTDMTQVSVIESSFKQDEKVNFVEARFAVTNKILVLDFIINIGLSSILN